MAKTSNDILQEWVLRGYITAEQSANPKWLSYISQAKDTMLSYCNIPIKADMPDGLYYAWVDIAWGIAQGTLTIEGSGEIKSVSEGDTTITYDVGTKVVKNDVSLNYMTTLNRYRRIAW